MINLLLTNINWDAVSGVLGGMQTIITGFVAWYGYKKYLSEETIEPSDERIQIFVTSKQTTELRVTDSGLECHIFDIRNGRGGHQWTQSKAQCTNVKVTSNATSSKAGRVTIGDRKQWLYSHKLWQNPADLENAIMKLVEQI